MEFVARIARRGRRLRRISLANIRAQRKPFWACRSHLASAGAYFRAHTSAISSACAARDRRDRPGVAIMNPDLVARPMSPRATARNGPRLPATPPSASTTLPPSPPACRHMLWRFSTRWRHGRELRRAIRSGISGLPNSAWRCHPNAKLCNGWSRLILRRAMQGILPNSVQWRRDKHDFTPLLLRSMLDYHRSMLDDILLANRDNDVGGYVRSAGCRCCLSPDSRAAASGKRIRCPGSVEDRRSGAVAATATRCIVQHGSVTWSGAVARLGQACGRPRTQLARTGMP